MQINVVFRHMDQSDAIREYAVEKLSKIKKYLDLDYCHIAERKVLICYGTR